MGEMYKNDFKPQISNDLGFRNFDKRTRRYLDQCEASPLLLCKDDAMFLQYSMLGSR